MSSFTIFTLFGPSVAFHIETSHLISIANQMTGFYRKCNTGLKWVKLEKLTKSIFHSTNFEILNLISHLFLYQLFGCCKDNFRPHFRCQSQSPNVILFVSQFRPEGQREPCNKIVSLNPAKRPVGVKPVISWSGKFVG